MEDKNTMQNNDRTKKLMVGAVWVKTKQGKYGEYKSITGSLDRKQIEKVLKETTGDRINIAMNNNKKAHERMPDYKIVALDVEYVKPETQQTEHNFGEQPRFDTDEQIPF